jgi:hypothetical protein
MLSKMRILAITAIVLVGFVGYALASPPVPPPTEGYVITTSVDVEMSSGDFTEVEAFTSTWVHDTEDFTAAGAGSQVPRPGQDYDFRNGARAAQIRYTEEMGSTDTSFFQFNKEFGAFSHGSPTGQDNLTVEKNYGYVASEASLIANAENKERVGLSIVANGDSEGFGDMPSLCPWAHGAGIPATNEFIAMGSDTSTTSVMVSDTETLVAATRAPEMDHSISAVGIGLAAGLMQVALQEGGQQYNPDDDGTVPDLVSSTTYTERTTAVGTIDKFFKGMHYHSTIPAFQLPEPWYVLQ